MAKYLDINGLAEVWAKMKSHVSSGYVSKTGDDSINGGLSVKNQVSASSIKAGAFFTTAGSSGAVIHPNSANNKFMYFKNTADTTDEAYEIATKKDIADLVNSAPSTLDTLGEVAKAIQDNETVVSALDSAIGNKLDKSGGSISAGLNVATTLTSSSVQSNSVSSKDKGTSGAMISFGGGGSYATYTPNNANAGVAEYEIATKKDLANIQLETLTTAEIEAICV